MINSGVVKLYAGTNELLAQKKYHTKDGRRRIVEAWMDNKIFNKLNCYYQIAPTVVVKSHYIKGVTPNAEKPKMQRPPAVYSNTFKVRDLN